MKLVNFIKDDNGKPSISRVLIFLMVVSYECFSWVIVLKTNTIPDIPVQMVGLILALYGINKFSKNENSGEEVK